MQTSILNFTFVAYLYHFVEICFHIDIKGCFSASQCQEATLNLVKLSRGVNSFCRHYESEGLQDD